MKNRYICFANTSGESMKFWKICGLVISVLVSINACGNNGQPENGEVPELSEIAELTETIDILLEVAQETSVRERHFLEGQQWDVLGETIGCMIVFRDGTYHIFFAVGGYYSFGDYHTDGNKVTLFYPEVEEQRFYGIDVFLEYLFSDDTQIELVYDPDYIDFDYISCLRNEQVLLRNLSWPSPAEQVYTLQGYDVIKCPRRWSEVIILENLRMRAEPDIHADTVSLSRLVLRSPSYEKYTSDLTYKNAIKSFDAKTVKEDTIDGITAPWYRILVILNEIRHEYVWVFGGYVRELEPYEISDREIWASLHDNAYQTLIDLNVIRGRDTDWD